MELIMSKTVSKIYEEKHISFSDFEKATIIYNSHYPREEIMDELADLYRKTKDKELKEQLKTRLEYEEETIRRFKTNEDGKCVYIVKFGDEEWGSGFFSIYKIAVIYGMNDEMKRDFTISKFLIIDGEIPMKRTSVKYNPYFFKDINLDKTETSVYSGDAEAEIHYYHNGSIKSIWSNEFSIEEEEKIDYCNPNRFENKFIVFYNPFERGDVVRECRSGEIGVV